MARSPFKYYIFYKPYDVLTQFSKDKPDQKTLSDFLKVGPDIYPVGRLDKDSEGLLILTNDPSLNSLLLQPRQEHKRTYVVQLDDDITAEALKKISEGVEIKLPTGTHKTLPCQVKKLSRPPGLPDRTPPVRFRAQIPTSWASIELSEGKNRQVRRMFAAVGFPVLRLVRVQIEELKLGKIQPGQYAEINEEELYRLVHIPVPKNRKVKTRIPTQDKKPLSPTSKSGKSFKEYRKRR